MESRLLSRFESALTHGATEHALALAMLAASLRTPETRDARVSTALAVSASQVAHERTAAARATEQGLDDPVWQDIRSLHLVAGEAYLAASEAHQSVGGDPEAWARTLFQGGVQLDLAGHLSEASMVFRDYINARDEDDPIRVDAMFRLAQALEAEAVFDEASQWYEQVIAGHPGSLPATRSYMPSARCLVAMGDDELARCRLRSVVDGETPLQPGAGDYRDSLVMLGRLAAREAAWSEAASRLREAADRWPSHPQTRSILFEVASAQRALALSIDDRLATQPLSPSARQELEADRLANLFEAAAVFQRVAEDLQDAATTSSWDLRMRRAAAVSRADCLFESGQRQEAIAGYEAVARTWPDHPAAMHALVQVASAWTMLGDYERADAAHQRALARLESMPDSALETHDGFMSRAVWERWMDTMPVGRDLFAGVDPDP
jgi:TolA-binding protein